MFPRRLRGGSKPLGLQVSSNQSEFESSSVASPIKFDSRVRILPSNSAYILTYQFH